MSPKLVRTEPHTVENRGITMTPLFLRLISGKDRQNAKWAELSVINLTNYESPAERLPTFKNYTARQRQFLVSLHSYK